jgi:hypothetical protein
MTTTDYLYPAEKFAFHECTLGLEHVDGEHLDADAKVWVQTVREIMDTTGIVEDDGRGRWFIKADSLSLDDKSRFSTAVDSLADWFASQDN